MWVDCVTYLRAENSYPELLLVALPESDVEIYDPNSGVRVGELAGSGGTEWVAASSDGQYVATGSFGGTRLWRIHRLEAGGVDAQPIAQLNDGSESVSSIQFSADGSMLATGSWNPSLVSIWDRQSGQLRGSFGGQGGEIAAISLLGGGKRVASGSRDGTVYLRNTDTGELIATFIGLGNEWIVMTPEGFFNVSSSAATHILSVVRGLESFGIEQFYQVLFRPDLVQEKLAGDPNGKVKEAAAKLDLQKLLDSGRVPKVAIASDVDTSPTDLITLRRNTPSPRSRR
jgi:WD40 repeat protein